MTVERTVTTTDEQLQWFDRYPSTNQSELLPHTTLLVTKQHVTMNPKTMNSWIYLYKYLFICIFEYYVVQNCTHFQ